MITIIETKRTGEFEETSFSVTADTPEVAARALGLVSPKAIIVGCQDANARRESGPLTAIADPEQIRCVLWAIGLRNINTIDDARRFLAANGVALKP